MPLAGGHNFRDIGGYPAGDGRSVARGLVFRSGALDGLTPADDAALARLGIRAIYDFRSTRERARRPTTAAAFDACAMWSRDHEESSGELYRSLTLPGADGEGTRARMQAIYAELPYEQREAYRNLFGHLAEGHLPLLFHCTGGKDRTGVAAALLLDVLGVARDVVLADYALSDRYFEGACAMLRSEAAGSGMAGIDETVWSPLVRADPLYVVAMFAAVERRHGSAAGFLCDELGLTDGDVGRIRERLLAPID